MKTSHGVILKLSRRVPQDIGYSTLRALAFGAFVMACYELIAR